MTDTNASTNHPYVYFSNNDRGEVGIGGDYDYDTDTREGTINLLEEGADDDGSDLSIFLHFKDAKMLRKIAMQLNQVADWMDGADA